MEEEGGRKSMKRVRTGRRRPHPALEDRFNDILAEKYPLSRSEIMAERIRPVC